MPNKQKTQTVKLDDDLRAKIEKEIEDIKARVGVKPSVSAIINKRVRMGYQQK